MSQRDFFGFLWSLENLLYFYDLANKEEKEIAVFSNQVVLSIAPVSLRDGREELVAGLYVLTKDLESNAHKVYEVVTSSSMGTIDTNERNPPLFLATLDSSLVLVTPHSIKDLEGKVLFPYELGVIKGVSKNPLFPPFVLIQDQEGRYRIMNIIYDPNKSYYVPGKFQMTFRFKSGEKQIGGLDVLFRGNFAYFVTAYSSNLYFIFRVENRELVAYSVRFPIKPRDKQDEEFGIEDNVEGNLAEDIKIKDFGFVPYSKSHSGVSLYVCGTNLLPTWIKIKDLVKGRPDIDSVPIVNSPSLVFSYNSMAMVYSPSLYRFLKQLEEPLLF